MAFLLQRIRTIASMAGRQADLDGLLRRRPRLGRSFIDGRARAMADAQVAILAHFEVETEAHSRRLAAWVALFARAIELPEARVAELVLGALFHDVGKLSVPDSVLQSPDALDPRALDLIMMHPSLGHACLFGLAGLEPAAELVLAHHEYWDGTGYPRRLREYQIPMAARLFGIVDTYDAMVRDDRLYRCGVAHEVAVAEIRELAGVKYDPNLVDAFARIDMGAWRAVGERWPDQSDAVGAPERARG